MALCQMLGCSPYESCLAPIICMVGAILFVRRIGTSVDNWFMHIFYNLPLIFINIVVSFVFVMLFGLEVDYIATILLPFQYVC